MLVMVDVIDGNKNSINTEKLGECIEDKIGIWKFSIGWGHGIPLSYLPFDYQRGLYVMQLKTSDRGM